MKYYKDILKIFKKLGIKNGDILYVASDLLKLIISFKNKNKKFSLDQFINTIIKSVGKNGTILIPTYNWDFCNNIKFDYQNTKSRCGALSNFCLKRRDFKRTRHPIYSMVVYGKFKDHLFNLDNKSSWGENSPFNFIYKKKAKNLFIGIDYKKAFTMDHYFEQKINVNYRFHKNFSAKYINPEGKISKKTYSMFVRNKKLCDTTILDSKLDKILSKKRGIQKIKNQNINYSLINIDIAGKILMEDLRKPKSVYIYPVKN